MVFIKYLNRVQSTFWNLEINLFIILLRLLVKVVGWLQYPWPFIILPNASFKLSCIKTHIMLVTLRFYSCIFRWSFLIIIFCTAPLTSLGINYVLLSFYLKMSLKVTLRCITFKNQKNKPGVVVYACIPSTLKPDVVEDHLSSRV